VVREPAWADERIDHRCRRWFAAHAECPGRGRRIVARRGPVVMNPTSAAWARRRAEEPEIGDGEQAPERRDMSRGYRPASGDRRAFFAARRPLRAALCGTDRPAGPAGGRPPRRRSGDGHGIAVQTNAEYEDLRKQLKGPGTWSSHPPSRPSVAKSGPYGTSLVLTGRRRSRGVLVRCPTFGAAPANAGANVTFRHHGHCHRSGGSHRRPPWQRRHGAGVPLGPARTEAAAVWSPRCPPPLPGSTSRTGP
jgi:hypothetical protein